MHKKLFFCTRLKHIVLQEACSQTEKGIFPINTSWVLNNLAAAAALGPADGLHGNRDNSSVIFHILQSIIFKDYFFFLKRSNIKSIQPGESLVLLFLFIIPSIMTKGFAIFHITLLNQCHAPCRHSLMNAGPSAEDNKTLLIFYRLIWVVETQFVPFSHDFFRGVPSVLCLIVISFFICCFLLNPEGEEQEESRGGPSPHHLECCSTSGLCCSFRGWTLSCFAHCPVNVCLKQRETLKRI